MLEDHTLFSCWFCPPVSCSELRRDALYACSLLGRLDLKMNPNDFTDAEAIVASSRITNGNFRLLNRLFRQIQRVIKINKLNFITVDTVDFVEAVRECLVIGAI